MVWYKTRTTMTKSLLNIGLLATTVFLCSFGAGLAIPVSLYNETSSKHKSDIGVVHAVNDTHNGSVELRNNNATVSKPEIDYESEEWRERERDHDEPAVGIQRLQPDGGGGRFVLDAGVPRRRDGQRVGGEVGGNGGGRGIHDGK